MRMFTIEELEALPTLAIGQTCDLKYESGSVRVWVQRNPDGPDNHVTVEVLDSEAGRWEKLAEYTAVRAGEYDPRMRGWQTMKLMGGQS